MEEDIYLDKLDRRGIKPTAIRLLVIKAMMQAERAVSLLDLETLLDTVDKSTISRTIALFSGKARLVYFMPFSRCFVARQKFRCIVSG